VRTGTGRLRTRASLSAGSLLLLLVVGLPWTATPSAAAPAHAASCARQDEGTTPVAKAVSDARHRPVVLVHGWNGKADSMKPVADALEASGSPVKNAVVTSYFAYPHHATEWANSRSIADCLATYLHDVSDAYRGAGGDGKVEVVAHSMGGLATRFASAQTAGGVPVGSLLAGVVTIDTPHLGSPFGGPTLGYGAIARLLEFANRGGIFFPGPGTDAGECLGLHKPPGNRIGNGSCATAPYLPAPARIHELAGEASVSRSLFGIHLYDVGTGSDGIVPSTSSYGYLDSGTRGKAPVGGHTSHTVVPCTTTLDGVTTDSGWLRAAAQAADQSVGELLSILLGTDQAAFDALAEGGKMNLALATFMYAVTNSASCSHSGMLREPTALADVAAAVQADDAAAREATRPLSAADLQSAPVPALCNFPAGRLVGGRLPGQPSSLGEPPYLPGGLVGRSAADLVALGDLDGNGIGDAAAVVNCNAGGVGWPDYIVFWKRGANGPAVLGAYAMVDAVGDARSATSTLTYENGAVVVDTAAARDFDAACCPSGRARVTLTWDGAHVVASDIQRLAGPEDVTFSAIGPVELGMSSQALEGLGYRAQAGDYYGCVLYDASSGPQVTYDPNGGGVVAIRPQDDGARTADGLGVGALLDDVRATYAGQDIEDHLDGSFGQGTSGLLVGDGSGGWISFATDDGAFVSAISLSDHEHMGAVEAGCS
jgi:hypothetical protein